MTEVKHVRAQITECIARDYSIEIKAGWEMSDGEPLWTFSQRTDGCLELRCGATDPPERMHVCNPVELHRLLGEVIAKARADGRFDLHDP